MARLDSPIAIDEANWADRARLQCPNGHGWWEANETTWYCRTCESSYNYLMDKKADWRVRRNEVDLTGGLAKR